MDAELNDTTDGDEETGALVKRLSKTFCMPRTILMQHLKGGKKTVGRKRVFTNDEEEELKNYIVELVEGRFLGRFFESYVTAKDHESSQTFLKHKDEPIFLGPDWMSLFLEGSRFSLEEATNL